MSIKVKLTDVFETKRLRPLTSWTPQGAPPPDPRYRLGHTTAPPPLKDYFHHCVTYKFNCRIEKWRIHRQPHTLYKA